MSRLLVTVCLIACCASLVLAGDRTLGTVSGPCKDQFAAIIRDHYAGDKECSDTIKAAMTTAPKSDADCPGGAKVDAGSSTQKCMTKSQKTKDAWITFIKGCEVLNVNERTGAGEAEAAADAKPSCFPRFNSLQAFKDFMEGSGAKKSSAGSTAAAAGATAAAAAMACLFML